MAGKKKRPRKITRRNPYAVTLPRFRPKVVRSKVRYQRKPKHPRPPAPENGDGA